MTSFAALALALVACVGAGAPDAPDAPLAVVLVSVDGLGAEILERCEAPRLKRLAAEGVRARSLIPVFPTKTFPNHYTIATGLWPEHHGVVSNTMVDRELDAVFRISDPAATTDARWWGGEPIWVTLERQGVRAATMFWPGSEAAIGGVRPTHWRPYDRDYPNEARVADVLGWLDLEDQERPRLVTLYFSIVDGAGHRYGPRSPEVADALRAVDRHIGALLDGLAQRGLDERVDVVVVSDHGMAQLDHERIVVVDDLLEPRGLRVVELSPVLGVLVEPEAEVEPGDLARQLDALQHVSAWRREDLPERLHLAHPRTPDVVAVADEGWRFARREDLERLRAGPAGGAHGYPPDAPSMHGVLLARGPSFRRGVVTGALHNVHVYELLCALLGVAPAPNDGSLDAVRHVLR